MKRNYIGLANSFHDSALAVVDAHGQVVRVAGEPAETPSTFRRRWRSVTSETDRSTHRKPVHPDYDPRLRSSWLSALPVRGGAVVPNTANHVTRTCHLHGQDDVGSMAAKIRAAIKAPLSSHIAFGATLDHAAANARPHQRARYSAVWLDPVRGNLFISSLAKFPYERLTFEPGAPMLRMYGSLTDVAMSCGLGIKQPTGASGRQIVLWLPKKLAHSVAGQREGCEFSTPARRTGARPPARQTVSNSRDTRSQPIDSSSNMSTNSLWISRPKPRRRITRADMALLESSKHSNESPFDCPLVAIGGKEDRSIDVETLEAWSLHTRGSFQAHWLPGGHFLRRPARDSE